jgi:glycosyltransferase involved in cell wall biosynthesis
MLAIRENAGFFIMGRPTVSVIIPSRNCIEFLPIALATIAFQGRGDLEVILADDGSTDGTTDWARARRNDKFTLKVLETGGIGPSAARNAAVAVAEADLIAFLDADDAWLAGKLNACLSL